MSTVPHFIRDLVAPRTWELKAEKFPRYAEVMLPPTASARMATILLNAGLAMTPSESLWSPASWFALFRYTDAFATGSAKLRLVEGARNWESRITTILAEEVGVGVAFWAAREHLHVRHVADFEPLRVQGEVDFVSQPVNPKHPRCRPDFACEDGQGEGVFIEAKGVVGTRSRLTRAMSKGKEQVSNVRFVRRAPRTRRGVPAGDRVVIGTHLCIDKMHPKSETTTILLDPPGPEGEHSPDSSRFRDDLLRNAYAKAFNFADRPVLASHLIARREMNSLIGEADRVVGNLRFHTLNWAPFGGRILIEDRVFRALASSTEDVSRAVSAALDELSERPSDDGGLVLLNNGIGWDLADSNFALLVGR